MKTKSPSAEPTHLYSQFPPDLWVPPDSQAGFAGRVPGILALPASGLASSPDAWVWDPRCTEVYTRRGGEGAL